MTDRPTSLVELRVLDGPNLYFPRPAVKLTLDLNRLVELPEPDARDLARRLGLTTARPGGPGTAFRQRFAARAVARLVRMLAAGSGTTRLAVRARPAGDVSKLVIAFPWRHRGKAHALGHAVADVLDALPEADVDRAVVEAAAAVRAAEPGDRPTTVRPHVPVVAVTGTNGKTTTSRMVAHIGRVAGRVVGWSNTDGIWVDGELVEEGDYSGPSGARRVLADPRVGLAVTETARGGILLRGMGTTHNDVSVVTNISADHLGRHGIDTLDQLAEVKAVVARVTRPEGWCVVNGEDPRTFAMRLASPARPWVFARDPDAPAVRAALTEGGRATTVLEGWITVLEPDADPDPLLPVVDVPMTLAGLSRPNVENALAAASAALAADLPRAAVVAGLRGFRPGPEHNPGRMNVYSVPVPGGQATVVLDLAHNEAGLQALLEVAAGLRPPGGCVRLALGTAGDRGDDVMSALGELAAKSTDDLVIVHKSEYLRGREPAELDTLYRAGAAAVGVGDVPSYGTELAGYRVLLDRSGPGDVVAVMCHQQRGEIVADLTERGGTVDDPDRLRAKVLAAG
ncbi:MAG TPA: Mur ligase family protein [Jiangellales bacterium]|nr:Mur ligase family protein [Jiangellales bacterium]